MNLTEEALKWAKRGVPVFPCGSNKAPLTTNGHLDASTDPDKVRKMFDFAGDNVMIGAVMGKQSKLFACDFDLYKDGAQEYMDQLAQKGLLTDTQIHVTKNGGLHFLYRSDTDYPNCKPHAGVEIKGEGGYIIVPPSSGYVIEKSGIAYAPAGLIEELVAARKEFTASTVDKLKADVISAKSFHDALTLLAAKRSAQGWTHAQVNKEIIETLSASVASTPQHPRHDRWKKLISDAAGELSRISQSSHEKFNQQKHTESLRERIDIDRVQGLIAASSGLFGNRDIFTQHGRADQTLSASDHVQNLLPSEGDLIDEWPFANEGFFSTTERDILSQRYIMYPLFAEKETMLIAAEPKAGKTAISLKLAMCIASGRSLGENLKVTDPRDVLYFTLEGVRAVEMRIKAEQLNNEKLGIVAPDVDRLFLVDKPQNLGDTAVQAQVCAKIIAHDRKCKQEHGDNLGAIFIDTLTKAMPGRDQNSVEDTSQLFEMVSILRTHGVTATIVFVHHLSRQGEVRGSTNIEAEVDVILSVEKTKTPGIVKMIIRRARSIDESVSYRFRFTSYYLGETVQGHKLHAPIVDLVEAEDVTTAGEAARAAKKWSDVCNALINELGKGKHDTLRMVAVLSGAGIIERPKARRPRADNTDIQKALGTIFEGKYNWSFGEFWLGILRDDENLITGIDIRAV